MRLSPQMRNQLKQLIVDELGESASVRLFGSRLDDHARGGDVDLLVESARPIEHPARLSARLGVRAMRILQGRDVDVILVAPNLQRSAIHQMALNKGVEL